MYKCSRIEPTLTGKKKVDFIVHFCLRRVGLGFYSPDYTKGTL